MIENKKKPKNIKILFFLAFICLLVIILCFRLFNIQLANEKNYQTLSEQNRIRILSTAAPRGIIYDANMNELASSKPVFAVALASAEIEDRDLLAEKLAAILKDPEITKETILETLQTHYRRYEPVVIKRIAYDEEGINTVTLLEEMRDELPGVIIMEEPMRYYPYGDLAGHILGTVGLLSADEEDLVDEYGYLVTDWLGKSGIEKQMERFTLNGQEIGLRGDNGVEQVEVNAQHQTVRTISSVEPVAGNSVVLTLDADVQKTMESSLEEVILKTQEENPKCRAGAAALINCKTGAVIAMASYPKMDPNDFANGLSTDKADYYFSNQDKPSLNRAISGAYPPGSTFKMATAVSLLANNIVSKSDTVLCSPSNWIKPRASCPKSHGIVNIIKALTVSCNTYFQVMAEKLGIDNLYQTCLELGFGQDTGIDLPGESQGVLPSPAWKSQKFTGWEEDWHIYDTDYMSMGQGYNMDTPIQLANYVAAIANNGTRMTPYLVDKVLSPEGEVLYQKSPTISAVVNADPEDFDIVKQGMRGVVLPGGTASSIFYKFGVDIAAKTGTAQTGEAGATGEKDYHGIFVAFAPYDDPEVAFACVIEYGYHGGTSGGLVCKAVLEEYYGLNPEPLPDELPSGDDYEE